MFRLPTFLPAITIFLLLTSAPASAQVQGWVMPAGGDTIAGLISTDGFYVYHRQEKNKAPAKYPMKQVKAYCMGKNTWVKECMDVIRKNFVERDCGFVRVLVLGEVNLYQFDAQDLYSEEVHTNYYLRRGTEGPLLLAQRNEGIFRKDLAGFFSDNEELSRKILNKELKYDQVMQIVLMHNEWAAKRSSPTAEPTP